MGLTERHWFENEDVPENYEWALEDAASKMAHQKERHGEWIGPECSLCHAILERPIKYNYCPFCGANMT